MKEDIKATFKIAGTYIGTVLGAGFASGQEILSFFVIHGYSGLYGLLFVSVIFALIGAVMLNKIYVYNISSYDEYIIPLLGKKMGRLTEIIVCLFMLSSFCVMAAGSGSLFYEEFGINKNIGIIIMIVFCYIVFLNDIKAVITMNSILAPLMLLGIIIIGLHIILFDSSITISFSEIVKKITNNWAIFSIVYVSYNTLTLLIIMVSLLPIINGRLVGILGGILGGVSLGGIAMIIFLILRIFYPDIVLYEIPFLYVAEQEGKAIELLYVFILYSAMFTTAIASGYGFINRMIDWLKIKRNTCIFVFCIFAFFLAKAGFANLVNTIYPLFGYIGLFLVIIILFDGLKEMFCYKGKNKKYFTIYKL